MLKIKEISIHHVKMKLKSPFQSSIETVNERESLIIEMKDADGVIGWGEVVAFSSPWYTEETIQTAFHMLKDFLIPIVFKTNINHPKDIQPYFQRLKRNHMAKAGLDLALWDLYAKRKEKSLSKVLGGKRQEIEAGVVVSIESIPKMIEKIEAYAIEGYRRFKVKISPKMDHQILREIRKHFPNLPLMADANSAYTLHDIKHIQSFDQYQLMMIEQPLGADDLVDHAKLQNVIQTPICLDESIHSLHDVQSAIQLNSCKIINVKAGRVGGLTVAKDIHDICEKKQIPIWCGGMIETGISRAHNIALASLPNFSIPGDISASSRYWEEDLIEPEVTINNGIIKVPDKPGIGIKVSRKNLEKYCLHEEKFINS